MKDNGAAASESGPGRTEGISSGCSPIRGEMIGDYRIIRKLGEGGMGIVFEAEQQHPHRPVALKVIRGGRYVSEQEVKLFRREAQALARLKHPAIAAIYENGRTSDGQHFFAMELVRGEPLSKLVAAAKDTDIAPELRSREGKLQLFVRICEAVNYAHQRGVIHRDLKPGNIMIARVSASSDPSSQPVPEIKILDFGLARITDTDLTATTVHSDVGALYGTLPYMSPEQARGNPDEIDVRSDVYALGVVLYEMMLGRLPLDLEGLSIHEIVQAICEKPPHRPRQAWLDSHWKGSKAGIWADRDLEIIMLKALEKDPNRRYQSSLALAEDVQRYLDDQPILARSPSVTYQLQKLVARHKAGFAFASSLLVLLVGFAVAMAVQAGRIAAERDRANEEAATARQVSEFLVGLFEVSDPSEARGNTITAREILDQGAEKIDRELEGQPRVRARLLNTMGKVYFSLGLYDSSRSLLEDGLAIREQTLGPEATEVAGSLEALGNLLWATGDYEEAQQILERALAIREETFGLEDPSVASSLNSLANVFLDTGDYERAQELYERSIAVWEKASGPDHVDVTRPLNNLGLLLFKMGDYEGALPLYERTLAIQERTLGLDHPDLATALSNLAILHATNANFEEARPLFERILVVNEKAFGPDHPAVGSAVINLGIVNAEMGDFETARPLLERALAIRERSLGPEHPDVATSLNDLGNLMMETGDMEGARPYYERALEINENTLGVDHHRVAVILIGLAHLLRQTGEYEEARSMLERSLVINEGALGADHPATATSLQGLAELLLQAGDHDQARFHLERALQIREEKLGLDHPHVADTLEVFAELLRELGEDTRAGELEARAEEIRAGQRDSDPN